MGASTSKLTSASLHIIRVTKGSAADRYSLLPIFHYIVAVNDVQVFSEEDIVKITNSWENGSLKMLIYDSRLKDTHTVEMIRIENEKIGFSIKLHKGEMAPLSFRIMDVGYNSPGIEAGLHRDQDYIIGHEGGSFANVYEFESILEKHRKKKLLLLVYNIGMISIRKVEISPNEHGEIGCDLGSGILNDVPYQPGKVEIVDEIVRKTDTQPENTTNTLPEEYTAEEPLPADPSNYAETAPEKDNEKEKKDEKEDENPEKDELSVRSDPTADETDSAHTIDPSLLASRIDSLSINTRYSEEIDRETPNGQEDHSSQNILSDRLQAEIHAQEIEQDLDESLYASLNAAEPAANYLSTVQSVPENEEVEDHIARISQLNQNGIFSEQELNEISPTEPVFDYEYEESKSIASNLLTETNSTTDRFLTGTNCFTRADQASTNGSYNMNNSMNNSMNYPIYTNYTGNYTGNDSYNMNNDSYNPNNSNYAGNDSYNSNYPNNLNNPSTEHAIYSTNYPIYPNNMTYPSTYDQPGPLASYLPTSQVPPAQNTKQPVNDSSEGDL